MVRRSRNHRGGDIASLPRAREHSPHVSGGFPRFRSCLVSSPLAFWNNLQHSADSTCPWEPHRGPGLARGRGALLCPAQLQHPSAQRLWHPESGASSGAAPGVGCPGPSGPPRAAADIWSQGTSSAPAGSGDSGSSLTAPSDSGARASGSSDNRSSFRGHREARWAGDTCGLCALPVTRSWVLRGGRDLGESPRGSATLPSFPSLRV